VSDRAQAEANRREFLRAVRRRHPRFIQAVLADAAVTSRHRGRPLAGSGRPRMLAEAARLAWESDGFLAQIMYRGKARLQGLGVPILPRVLHRLAIRTSGIYIGDPVVVEAGVHLAHGQIVIDGLTEIEAGATIFPFTTIGRTGAPVAGPKLRRNVTVGTGAKVLGPIEVGAGATIGANAVVLADVPADTTVAGVPAKVVRDRS
jgi:serine O-acetyltransferase